MNRHNGGHFAAVVALVAVGITLTTAPVAAAWTPPLRVVSGQFGRVSEVVDSANHIHIAAAGRGGVWYMTDRSGSWVSRRILVNPPFAAYGSTSIALDENDRVFIATVLFAEVGDQGIWLVSDKGRPRGTFPSQPKHIPGSGQSPTVKVSHGHLLIADVDVGCCVGDYEMVQLHSNATGRWTVTKVGRGRNPALRVGADGRPRIVFESRGLTQGSYHPGIYYAEGSSPQGPFSVAKIPHTGSHDSVPALALADTNEPHATWFHANSVSSYQAYVWHDSTGWHGPMEFARDVSEYAAFELDTLGRPNLAFGGSAIRHEVLIGETWHQTTVAYTANVGGLAMRRAFGGHVAIAWWNPVGIWVSRN